MIRVAVLTGMSRAAAGIFEVSRQLAQEQHRAGLADVHVLGLADAAAVADAADWLPLRPRLCRAVGPLAFGYSADLARALSGIGPDLVHAHGAWLPYSFRRWARSSGTPYLISVHGMLDPWALANSGWKKRLARRLFADAILRGAACIHVGTEDEMRAARECGITAPICLLPNGVEMPAGAPGVPPPWAERTRDGERVLLYLSRLHPKKGVDELIRGWGAARREAPGASERWRLALVGWGEEQHMEHYRSRAADLVRDGSVWWYGPQDGAAKSAAMFGSDAFVLPSHSEGIPMALLDAWAHALPTLQTPQCNLPAGVDRGAALLVEPRAESVAEGLVRLFSMTDAERTAMGRRGRELVEEEFSWPTVAARFQEVYEWMLSRSAVPEWVHVR